MASSCSYFAMSVGDETDLRRVISQAGFTEEDAQWLREGDNAERIMRLMNRIRRMSERNPFALSIAELFRRLREQNEAWRAVGMSTVSEEDIVRLHASVPEWPHGRDAYLSLRIRFGEGRDGMIQTFEAHAAAFRRVHPNNGRWKYLLSGTYPYKGEEVDRLRLLNGNDTHHPVVEWMVIPDLSAHRKRQDITSVRGATSLADEGLALAWLYKERVDAIDYKKLPAWFCAGYELYFPEEDDDPWRHVPMVDRCGDWANLHAYWRSDAVAGNSVPSSGSAVLGA